MSKTSILFAEKSLLTNSLCHVLLHKEWSATLYFLSCQKLTKRYGELNTVEAEEQIVPALGKLVSFAISLAAMHVCPAYLDGSLWKYHILRLLATQVTNE